MAFGRKLSCFKLGDICGERVLTFCKKVLQKHILGRSITLCGWLYL
jgi:hypothetical protein